MTWECTLVFSVLAGTPEFKYCGVHTQTSRKRFHLLVTDENCLLNKVIRYFIACYKSQKRRSCSYTYCSITVLRFGQLNNWLFGDDEDVSGSLRGNIIEGYTLRYKRANAELAWAPVWYKAIQNTCFGEKSLSFLCDNMLTLLHQPFTLQVFTSGLKHNWCWAITLAAIHNCQCSIYKSSSFDIM